MRVKLKEIAFADGTVFVDLYNLSFRVKAIVNTHQVNGLAGSNQGALLQGEEIVVERVFTNSGRLWISGKTPEASEWIWTPKI
ncbi:MULTISPECIES: hypothetical protein [Trichocoleus]|uniref:Uncharacterized protein n=1 Tax=Trichocoleus desertorum GB2-A4 TaxID=2933944 RepID=A0ABV0JHD6_9CYAN|nr:hypothetical protein [Trichocoleus sp. FACHB-46]MBD1862358.1 hypothetical protein [Trichocoleus sp. FACHB-46]